jgi:hypothetical protein
MVELSVVPSKLVYEHIRSSINQLQRTGYTGHFLSERGSTAAELERSKEHQPLRVFALRIIANEHCQGDVSSLIG